MCNKCNHAQQSSVRKTFLTHNDTNIQIAGVKLHGFMETNIAAMTRVFGTPHNNAGGCIYGWDILFEDGTVAQVYCTKAPDAEIWGHNYLAVDLVKRALKG